MTVVTAGSRVAPAACSLLAHWEIGIYSRYGSTTYVRRDLIYNHITARIPGTEHLLINLYGLLYKEITASGW